MRKVDREGRTPLHPYRAVAMRYSPNVRIAEAAALGVFYRENNKRAVLVALGASPLNPQGGTWSALRRPEGVLNDEGLRGADMADEQFPLVYELF